MKAALALAVAGIAAAACAPMDGSMNSASNDVARCLRTADVDNFRVVSSQQAYVHSRRGGAFRLDAAPNCFEPSTTGVVVEPYVAASPEMCAGDQVRTRTQMTSGPPRTCVARIEGPITDGAVSGLPG